MNFQRNENQSTTTNIESYLSRNFIIEYLNDSVQQLLEIKNSNQKVDVLEFFTEYFNCVKQGNHIMFRDYNFIMSTPYNRMCFLKKFLEIYSHMLSRGDLINVAEYHSLLLMISSDFSINLIQKAIKLVYNNQENENGALFKDFLNAFRFQLYYIEFIDDVEIIFKIIQDFIAGTPVQKNLINNEKLHLNNIIEHIKFQSEKDFLKLLSKSIEILASIVNYSIPPKDILTEIITFKGNSKLSFSEFIKEIYNNDKIVQLFGTYSHLEEIEKESVQNFEDKNNEPNKKCFSNENLIKQKQTDSETSSNDSSDTDT